MRLGLYTSCALIAFAGNSVLCRLALRSGEIDAASFTSIRLVSGAVVLCLALKLFSPKTTAAWRGSWISAAALFSYAAAFSFAYLSLATGTGALILFGAVQMTMIMAALLAGERLKRCEYLGVSLAFGGLVYLVFPGVTAPSLTGSLLMAGAGISWGIYSLRGRNTVNPLAQTAMNFAFSLPFVALLSLCFISQSHLSLSGILLAVLSGGLASGLGYALWYLAVMGMTTTKASIVQLAVPVLAAIGGTLFLAEELSARLIVSTIIILGGVALGMTGDKRLRSIQEE